MPKGETPITFALETAAHQFPGTDESNHMVLISDGKLASFNKPLASMGCNVCGPERSYEKFIAGLPQPIYLRLGKKGRSYVASAKFEGPEREWLVMEKLTSPGAKGNLVLGMAHTAKSSGESLMNVDWVKIEAR